MTTKIGTLKVKEKLSSLRALRLVADSEEHARSALDTYILREQNAQKKFNAIRTKARIAAGTGVVFMLGGAILYAQGDAIAQSYNDYMVGKRSEKEMQEINEQMMDCVLPNLLRSMTLEEFLQ